MGSMLWHERLWLLVKLGLVFIDHVMKWEVYSAILSAQIQSNAAKLIGLHCTVQFHLIVRSVT